MTQWQPIETAPKDGTLVLTACAPTGIITPSEWMTEVRWMDEREPQWFPLRDATHWMPLPPPPVQP